MDNKKLFIFPKFFLFNIPSTVKIEKLGTFYLFRIGSLYSNKI